MIHLSQWFITVFFFLTSVKSVNAACPVSNVIYHDSDSLVVFDGIRTWGGTPWRMCVSHPGCKVSPFGICLQWHWFWGRET